MPAWSIANRRLRPRSPSSARSFVAAKTFTPRRFESRKTGKSGYQPACANEWVRGLCEKTRVKCAECPNRRFLPVTDEAIRWHLSGQDGNGRAFVMGVHVLGRGRVSAIMLSDGDRNGESVTQNV